MRIDVRLFALARELASQDRISVDLPPNATVGRLRKRLSELVPNLQPILSSSSISVNNEYAKDDASIPPGAEVACIPPVSGG